MLIGEAMCRRWLFQFGAPCNVLQNVTACSRVSRALLARSMKIGRHRENHAKKMLNKFFGPVAESCPEHAGTRTIGNLVCDFGAICKQKSRRKPPAINMVSACNQPKASRFSWVRTLENSTATPSWKWRTTRPRILPRRTGVPSAGRTSISTAAPETDRSMMRQG